VTIWYDYTTSLRNTGRSGIANVEWSVGRALRAADPSVRAFSLANRGGLTEIDADRELTTVLYASPEAGPPRATIAPVTWRDHVRVGLVSVLGRHSTKVIRAISAAYQRSLAARRWIAGERDQVRTPRTDMPRLADVVGSGDVVISLGADWEGEVVDRLADLKRRTGCRVVTMVYDLIPLTHPHLAFHNDPAFFETYYRRLVAASDLITCISQQSREDLRGFAADRGITLPAVEVLLLGEELPDRAPASVQRQAFFLCVGTVERRKNLELLYDALRILESRGHTLPTIVVAGALGWGVDDLGEELALQSTAASRAIVLLGPVQEDTLEQLYRRARALLFPSHYEGWGLPVREAAVRGCPVAAGDSPAVREAAASYAGATLLPTDDPVPWADYLLTVPADVEPIAARGWDETALQLVGHIARAT
jgi:glycosyltransferase involved in cell wall biosynthesis